MMILTASLLMGLAVSITLWQTLKIVTDVPAEDRLYRDTPAMGFRLVWPLIRLCVFYSGRFMSEKTLDTLQIKLGRAGAEYSLNARELLASKYVASALFSAAASSVVVLYGSTLSFGIVVACVLGFNYPDNWLKKQAVRRQALMVKDLPFYLDVITLSVESGSNLTGAITQAVQKCPDSVLRRELSRVLREIRSGKTRAEALRDFANRSDSVAVNQVVSGLIQGEKAGANLGPMLREQAEQLRTRRFQKAEKLAMEAPVKLLGPLFICIFPMTFVVLGFVMLSKGIHGGFIQAPIILWAYGWPNG